LVDILLDWMPVDELALELGNRESSGGWRMADGGWRMADPENEHLDLHSANRSAASAVT